MSINSWIENQTWSVTEWLWQPSRGQAIPSSARSSSKSLGSSLAVICRSTWRSHFSSRACLAKRQLITQLGLSKLITHWLRTNNNSQLTRLSTWQDTQLMSSHHSCRWSLRKHTQLNLNALGVSTRSGGSSSITILGLSDASTNTCVSKLRRPQHSSWATSNLFWTLAPQSRTYSVSCLMLRRLKAL